MKTSKTTSKLFSISCTSSKGVLGKLLSYISHTTYRICTVSESSTDLLETALITLELEIEGKYIDDFIKKIEEIEGIHQVTVSFGSVLLMATYHMIFDSYSNEILHIIKSHNTQVISIAQDKLIILHIASEKDIQLLYNKLDTKRLIAFSKMPLSVG